MAVEKRIGILHTTPHTISSLGGICARLLPEVKVNHYLDDSILQEINRVGEITPSCRYRFFSMTALAAAAGPDAILCACSSVGGMLEEARAMFRLPLLRIDEPMARAAADRGGRIVVCATVRSTLGPTLDLIRRYAGEEASVDTLLIGEAGRLMAGGDREAYLSAISSRLDEAAEGHDTAVLAQASMAEALTRLPEEKRVRFLTSPESGVKALRGVLGLE